MLSFRIPKELELRLEELCKHTERSKAYYIKKALEKFIENEEDYLLAAAVLAKKEKTIPFDEVKKLIYGKTKVRDDADMDTDVRRPAKSYTKPSFQKVAKARDA